MYSPKELEGEVDHSFFDSDCEANGTEDEQINKQESSQGPDERKSKETNVLIDQIGSEVQSGRRGTAKASLEDGLRQTCNENKECVNELTKERQSSNAHFKGSSPILSAKSSGAGDNIQSDEGSSVQSYSSDEDRELDDEDSSDFKLRENGDLNSDDDGYHRSDDESEEEDNLPETQSSKHRGYAPKKSAGKFRKQSRSSSSDAESSHSSEEKSSVCSQKSPMKHHRVGSANQRERAVESAESEDTVTDVTPLSTPNVSPAQSIDVVLPSEPLAADALKIVVNEEGSDDQGSISSEGENEPALLKIEKQLDRMLVSSPGSVGSSRKNYSFNNEEVRRIDRENQRLLRELSRSSARSRSGSSTFSSTSSRKNNAPSIRLYHSAMNRQKEQERIQKENLSFLRRLESVKATPGLTRDEQLADYQRQCRYLGTHAPAIPPLTPKSSKTSGRSSRPCSSPQKDRPGTAKHNRATPRPAWS